jgi:hypothetical protein
MLGSLTTPNGLSAGSPERYWACVRYFSAFTDSPELRIHSSFIGLDPHQKGILSDDFGVALSTAWLVDTLGGIRDIVNGRQFMINMGIKSKGKRPPKVGPKKCPDFVLKDKSGKLHVLECKGTQSGLVYLARAMSTGREQKRGIEIARALRGESLVIGVSLSGDGDDSRSQLSIVDPDVEPLTFVQESDAKRAAGVLARLRLARALNLSGFSRMASEIALPAQLDKDSAELGLLTHSERRSLFSKPSDRWHDLEAELQTEFASVPDRRIDNFFVSQMQFDMPAIRLDSGEIARRITVRRGISSSLIQDLADAGQNMRDAASDVSTKRAATNEMAHFSETERSSRLEYHDLLFSEIVFD